MLACLVSSKYGAGMLCVPSELPSITSRHWLGLASESAKKLYNKTCMVLKTYDSFTQCDLHHWILSLCTHSMSYGVCYMGESWHWQKAHMIIHASFNCFFSCCLISLLRTRTPRFSPMSKFPKGQRRNYAFTLICSKLNWVPFAITKERFLQITLFI